MRIAQVCAGRCCGAHSSRALLLLLCVAARQEEEELIAEWKPEPLCPAMPPSNKSRFVVERSEAQCAHSESTQR